jgi:hypothetical protein
MNQEPTLTGSAGTAYSLYGGNDDRMAELHRLILDLQNASFDCGAWDDDEASNTYDEVLEVSRRAKTELLKWIENQLGLNDKGQPVAARKV